MNESLRRRTAVPVGLTPGRRWAMRWPLPAWRGPAVVPDGAPRLDFDALAKDVAQGLSRRELIRRLAAGLVAGIGAELLSCLAPAGAATLATPAGPCSSSKAAACLDPAQNALANALAGCFPEGVDQSSVGFWLAVDQCLGRSEKEYALARASCLGAGAGCPAGSECSNDLCCPAGQVGCGAVCCAAGQRCVEGVCSSGGTGGNTDTGPSGCAAGQTLCGGACVDLQSDGKHCGACGKVCDSGLFCSQGSCVEGCPPGLTACGGGCVNLQSDRNNCGVCGRTCPSGQRCDIGACVCPSGLAACSGICVNLQSDFRHCGACGNVCSRFPFLCCSGVCKGATDTQNCGACGQVCPTGVPCCDAKCCAPPAVCSGTSNIGPACVCPAVGTVKRCSGECVDTATNRSHCGACGKQCLGGQSCVNGQCTFSSIVCPIGQTNCSGVCVNLQTDKNNCGACGTRCGLGRVCRAGKCVIGI
jgi:hypothetical protein